MQPKSGRLGSYNSSLTAEYYQKLLALLNDAISSGDLSGGSAFDKATLLKLEEQAQSFASLPTGTAGVRVMDDSLNYPLSLLEARLAAMAGEAGNFTTISGRLLDILAHETRSLACRANNTFPRAGEIRKDRKPFLTDSGLPAVAVPIYIYVAVAVLSVEQGCLRERLAGSEKMPYRTGRIGL